jgi:hypothetical protein
MKARQRATFEKGGYEHVTNGLGGRSRARHFSASRMAAMTVMGSSQGTSRIDASGGTHDSQEGQSVSKARWWRSIEDTR